MILNTRTPSKIMLTTLDTSLLKAKADAYVIENHGPDYTAGLGRTFAAIETPEGVFALCTEGVGPSGPISKDNPLVVDIYAEQEGYIAMVPVASANLDADDVRKMMTGPQVNLAEHVRTFGARLDANYEMWLRRLSPLANALSLSAQ